MRDWVGNRHTRVQYPCGPDCPRRHPGCQDHCPDMIKAKAENERLRREERIQKAEETASREAIRKACRANKKN